MTKLEFEDAMIKIKEDIAASPTGSFICNRLYQYLGKKSKAEFQTYFKPQIDIGVYFSHDISTLKNDITITFSNDVQRDLRMTAILLFEQQCLHYKLYLGW